MSTAEKRRDLWGEYFREDMNVNIPPNFGLFFPHGMSSAGVGPFCHVNDVHRVKS